MKKFYEQLWEHKADTATPMAQPKQRDWFHRNFLDRLIDPYANNRHAVTQRFLDQGDKLLDIGCWDGQGARKCGAFDHYREIHGVDITEKAVQAAQRNGVHAKLVDLNYDTLPYPNAFFDCVTMLAVLEHVLDPYLLIREARRVLKPTGILIIALPNVASFSNRARILLGRTPVTSNDPGMDGGHLHYFTPHDTKSLLKAMGFQVIDRAATGGAPKLKKRLFSLSGEFVYKCRPF